MHGTLAATRMVTRLRNPDSKLSQQKSQQVAAALHESCKVFKEGKDVSLCVCWIHILCSCSYREKNIMLFTLIWFHRILASSKNDLLALVCLLSTLLYSFLQAQVVSQQAEMARLNSRSTKDLAIKGSYFRLGQEGKYRGYQNQYSTNTLALNKHQHREDHDKRRHLSHKFCLTPAGDFKWNGSIYGSRMLTMCTLRLTIIQLENNIPAPFLHPNWDSHRYRTSASCTDVESKARNTTVLSLVIIAKVCAPAVHSWSCIDQTVPTLTAWVR